MWIFAAGRHADVDSEGYLFHFYHFDVWSTLTLWTFIQPTEMKHIFIFSLVSALDITFSS